MTNPTFFFQAEDGIRDLYVTGVQTCALPISTSGARTSSTSSPTAGRTPSQTPSCTRLSAASRSSFRGWVRSEEHTSELQSRRDLVCRLLLEKKKKKSVTNYTIQY